MKIAVIMLTYNRIKYTKKTISHFEKIIKDKSIFDFHILDNASIDGTKEFLKNYRGPLRINTIFMDKNLGVAEGTKFLLKEKCYGKNYDFIVKTDNDLLLPDGWDKIFEHFEEIEKNDAVVAGFKLKGQDQYFNGYKWVSTKKENTKKITIGDFECYKSYFVNGVQISREIWWKKIHDKLSDLGLLYGGWDYTFLFALKKLKKWCMVVFNKEIIDLQNEEEYKEFNKFKLERIKLFQQKFDEIESSAEKMWEKIIKNLREKHRKNPKDKHIIEAISKAYALKGNEKLANLYQKKLEKL